MRFSVSVLIFLLLIAFISGCSKDPAMPVEVGVHTDTSGAMPECKVIYKAMVNSKDLVPVTKTYTNTSGDNFTVTKFNYYISNVKLKKSDGSYFVEPESYHLIKHVDSITSFTIHKLPVGSYTSIEFLIGVDSLRNVSGAQTGDLATDNLMYWDWLSGYIFFKLEGEFSSPKQNFTDIYQWHIGGFEMPYSTLQWVSLPFPAAMEAKKGRVNNIVHKVNIDEIFNNPKKIGFDYYYENVGSDPAIFKDISVNYKDMFSIEQAQ